MNTQVSHFGVHRADNGVAFVHQGAAGHNFIGWKQPSPFEVIVDKRVRCPHALAVSVGHPDTSHWELFIRLYEDPLFRAFLPIPKTAGELTPFLDDAGWTEYLVLLSKLAAPVVPTIYPFSKISTAKLHEQLSVTNLGPLVLTGIETSDQRYINDLVMEAKLFPRKLLLVGHHSVVVRPPMERIVSSLKSVDWLKLLALPMEQLGAVALRRYARAEQINSPFLKRETS